MEEFSKKPWMRIRCFCAIGEAKKRNRIEKSEKN
jgi:hypothetical protein